MAIVINNDGDKVVNTITERNALPTKFIGMNVVVNDATGDPAVGSGSATYTWLDVNGVEQWVTSSVSDGATINFVTEKKTIVGGQVTADNVPLNASIWTVRILNADNVIVGDIAPTVTGALIDLGILDYDGLTLEYTYGYGSFTAQLSQVLGDLVDQHAILTDFNIDMNIASMFTKTVTVGGAFTVTNAPTAGEVGSFILEVVDGGSFTITWPPGTEWEGGVSPSLTVGGKDILAFYTVDGGVSWTGLIVGSDMQTVNTVT